MKIEEWRVIVLEALMKGIDPEDIVKQAELGIYGGRK